MDQSMNSVMTMTMPPMSTSTPSSVGPMGMGGMNMSGMDMGDMEAMMKCKISMLWNWYTINACFLSEDWHITSHGMFAGSCIGVICLVISLEFLRRLGREYDSFIVRRARLRNQYLSPSSQGLSTTSANPTETEAEDEADGNKSTTQCAAAEAAAAGKTTAQTSSIPMYEDQTRIRPTLVEQLGRALLHMFQFAVAYIIMLLAMYFNGYIIICIFIGAFLGAFIFSWEPLVLGKENDATAVTKCCG